MQYAVFALAVHLYDGVALGLFRLAQQRHVHAASGQQVLEHNALRADAARVVHLRAGPGQGDGLVQALAPGRDHAGMRLERLPRPHKVVHGIHIIHVQGSKIKYLHVLFLI